MNTIFHFSNICLGRGKKEILIAVVPKGRDLVLHFFRFKKYSLKPVLKRANDSFLDCCQGYHSSFYRGVNHERKSRTPMSEIQNEIRKSFENSGNPVNPSST